MLLYLPSEVSEPIPLAFAFGYCDREVEPLVNIHLLADPNSY